MTVEQRIDNAARRAREEQVRPIRVTRGQYVVASSSHPGQGYLVHLDTDGTVACTCPAAQWDFPCKHAVAVQEIERRRGVERMPMQPAPGPVATSA